MGPLPHESIFPRSVPFWRLLVRPENYCYNPAERDGQTELEIYSFEGMDILIF
jgi:hypothetical protein